MSADDWQKCPVCIAKAKEYVDYAYGKVPKTIYKEIVSKANYLSSCDNSGWNCNDGVEDFEYDGTDKKVDEIFDWIQYGVSHSESVRIDYEYSINDNGTYTFDFGATCSNCGHEFTEDKK